MPENGSMLRVLENVEEQLPDLLENADDWHTLDVDYEPPRVERLWRDIEGGHRVYLHRIHPCTTALFHPHPWPSAVRILDGIYEMAVGYEHSVPGTGQRVPNSKPHAPPRAATIILTKGSCYEMVDPRGWHSVRPLGTPSYSLMVTGPKWDRWSPKADHKLGPLTDEAKHYILTAFRSFYPS